MVDLLGLRPWFYRGKGAVCVRGYFRSGKFVKAYYRNRPVSNKRKGK